MRDSSEVRTIPNICDLTFSEKGNRALKYASGVPSEITPHSHVTF